MKFSNRLLIGFVGFVLIYMIVAFTELRLKGDNENLLSENTISETMPLGNYKYLIISDLNRMISVRSSRTPGVEIKSMKGGLLSSLKYRIAGDTLALTGLEAEGIRYEVCIFVPETGFNQIEIQNTNITLENLNLSEITVRQINANVSLAPDVDISKIFIKASENSNFTTREAQIDTISVNLQSSYAYLYFREALKADNKQVYRIEGSLTNSSRLIMYGSGEIYIKKDATSSISWIEVN